MPPLRPDQVTFLALYKELVETNTTLSAGSCTVAAERMAADAPTVMASWWCHSRLEPT